MKYSSHLKGLQNIGSVLGTATRIEGTVKVDETVRIDGRIEGNLEQSDGNGRWIIIGTRGEIHGDIRAENVSVAGKVIGNIIARNSIELLDGCEVRGNITHRSINVEPGASVHGQLIANDPQSEAEAARAIAQAKSGS